MSRTIMDHLVLPPSSQLIVIQTASITGKLCTRQVLTPLRTFHPFLSRPHKIGMAFLLTLCTTPVSSTSKQRSSIYPFNPSK
ncbi:hypothetical protein HPB50_003007 [Hyalomma asiaticum]|uniref:Uncharacterized protein n=1 Tax=Hyalomma asiaticum TaxID=266040 RepID=A0ACB7SZI2_HYAAI|nr:hypothetical protein HPB50_003007 [Hyalomma asiaticum]